MTQMRWAYDESIANYRIVQDAPKPKRNAPIEGRMVQAFLWTRTILCRNCTGLIPLSPNWRLSREQGIRLLPDPLTGLVGYEVVHLSEASIGSVRKAIATCPICGWVCPKGYPAAEARAKRMG